MADPLPGLGRTYKCRFKQFLEGLASPEILKKFLCRNIFLFWTQNSHGNVVGVGLWTAPRAPMVKAPDFEKPLRGDNGIEEDEF